jgi:hypothetical protein
MSVSGGITPANGGGIGQSFRHAEQNGGRPRPFPVAAAILRARGKQPNYVRARLNATSPWPAQAGHPRLCCRHREKTWMPTCVGMTVWKRPLRHVEHLFPGES